MNHTKLLACIIDYARGKQNDAKETYLYVDFVYLVYGYILKDKNHLKDIGINLLEDTVALEEYSKLVQLVDLDSYVRMGEIFNKVDNKAFTDEDRRRTSKMVRWLTVSSRDSISLWNQISEYYISNKNTSFEDEELNNAQEDFSNDDTKESLPNEEKASEDSTGAKEDQKENEGNVSSLVSECVSLRTALLEKVYGQDHAVKKFTEGFFKGEVLAETNPERKGPRSVFLFLGTPGVGKTYLAETAAKAIGRPFLRLDMSGYSDSNSSVDQLTGIPENYQGSREGELTKFVKENPKCVVLFDEIEKAHSKVILLFLQMLDAGVIMDTKTKKPVNLKDTVLIFTTNAGRQLYDNDSYGKLSSVPTNIIMDALEKDINPATGEPFFPQAIVSRLGTGTILMFDSLPASQLIRISGNEMSKFFSNVEKKYDLIMQADDSIDATTVFSLGGSADGRNVTANAVRFISGEFYELLRLINAKKGIEAIEKLKKVKISVDFEGASDEVKKLYDDSENTRIIIYADKDRYSYSNSDSGCKVVFVSTLEEYLKALREDEATVSIIDFCMGIDKDENILNVEDMVSDGRTALETTIKDCPETVVYILENEKYSYNEEEKLSLTGKGASRFITIDNNGGIEAVIDGICVDVCHQNAVNALALKHKVLSYETLQNVAEDSTEAEIKLYNLKLVQAVESEDKKSLLSEENKPNVHWDDLVMSDEVKDELNFFVDYLRNPKQFLAKGAKVPKGALLYGPPGTGKTSLAKVVATESGVTFLEVSAEQFLSKYVGEGPQNVHKLFATARKYAPAILFIDEIDAIGAKRQEEDSDAGSRSTHEILNALLTEIDGFKTSVKKPVFVMAATNLGGNNRNAGSLDPALVRRFDTTLNIDLPNRDGRKKLLEILRNKNSAILKISDEIIANIADRSIGMSPANIEGAIDSAIREAIRSGNVVTDEMMDESFEKFVYGEEKKWDPSILERTAWHESGHALLNCCFGNVPSYLTIVARDDHGGYMQFSEDSIKELYTKEEMLQRICISLGGRAAEIIKYGEVEGISTGPSGDLLKATENAFKMICTYGMYDTDGFLMPGDKSISPDRNDRISLKISEILNEQLEEAKKILNENYDMLEKFANTLLDKQTLNESQIKELVKKM